MVLEVTISVIDLDLLSVASFRTGQLSVVGRLENTLRLAEFSCFSEYYAARVLFHVLWLPAVLLVYSSDFVSAEVQFSLSL